MSGGDCLVKSNLFPVGYGCDAIDRIKAFFLLMDTAVCGNCWRELNAAVALPDFITVGWGGDPPEMCNVLWVFRSDGNIYVSCDYGVTWTLIYSPAGPALVTQIIVSEITNNSGAALLKGDVVIWDPTIYKGVTTTTQIDHADIAGVWYSANTPHGGSGEMLVLGITDVDCDAAVTRGDKLVTSTTAGEATSAYSGHVIAVALETTGGAGFCEAFVSPQFLQTGALYTHETAAGVNAGATVAATWVTLPYNTLKYDPHNLVALAAGQFTLDAGVYDVDIVHDSYRCGDTALRLQNVTTVTTLIDVCHWIQHNTTSIYSEHCHLVGTFVSNGTDLLEIQMMASINWATGQGAACTPPNGGNEVYGYVRFVRR